MWTKVALVLCALPAASTATSVAIATFDGEKATTRKWQPVNDPVMGGQSKSTFAVDGEKKLGEWVGEVKIVPFLRSPGFCTLQTPGLFETADFPDLSGTEGLVARLRQSIPDGLSNFSMMIRTKKSSSPEEAYSAFFTAGVDMSDNFVPWDSFACTRRGQPVPGCPALNTQLADLGSIGFSTSFPGKAGKFAVELEALSAGTSGAGHLAPVATAGLAPTKIPLAAFDGSTQHKWHSENDPVMGGLSTSTLKVRNGVAMADVPVEEAVQAAKAPTETLLV